MDVATEITLLRLKNDDTIYSFYERVQDIETKLLYSHKNIDKTSLLKFYLKAMGISKLHFPFLQGFISDLNIHITKYGSNTPHPTHTCASMEARFKCSTLSNLVPLFLYPEVLILVDLSRKA